MFQYCHHKIWNSLSQLCLSLFLLVFLAGISAPEPIDTPSFSPPTSSFTLGVTLINGVSAPLLQGQSFTHIRVYTWSGLSFAPTPFQLDERDRRDRWVAEVGSDPNPDESPGIFDENDALVVMNRDLGSRGDPTHLPSGATLWAEVQVGEAATLLGYFYIGIFADPPPLPPSEPLPARYDPTQDRVYAQRYALEFAAPLPTYLALVRHLGDFGENIIAGVHAEGEVRLMGGLVTFQRSDRDIHTQVLGYRTGPLRVIRRARYWIPLPLGFRASGRVDLLFYGDFVEGTALVKVKIPPSLVLANGELKTYFDFLNLQGARLLLEDTTPGEPIDGVMTPLDQALNNRLAHWAALQLPDGQNILFIVRLEGGLQQLEQRVFFSDETVGNGSGHLPLFGFQFSRIDRLSTGSHRLSVFAVVLDRSTREDIQRTVALFLSPPKIYVTELPQQKP